MSEIQASFYRFDDIWTGHTLGLFPQLQDQHIWLGGVMVSAVDLTT